MSDLPSLTKWLRERFAVAQAQWHLRRDIQPVFNVLGAYRLDRLASENPDQEGAGAGAAVVTFARGSLVPEDRVHYYLYADASHNGTGRKAVHIGVENGTTGFVVSLAADFIIPPGQADTLNRHRVVIPRSVYVPAGFRLTAACADLAAPARLELRAWRVELLPGESF